MLTLLLELRCNNYCVFCGEREVDDALVNTRRRLGLAVPATAFGSMKSRYTLETATAALARARENGFTDLSLQGGEPTIWPDVVELVRRARGLGFGFVGIVTNGRKLKDPAFAEALIEAGLDGMSVSLLGPDAETHDAVAAAPGAFEALVTGLENAAAVAARLGRRVHVDANLVTSAKSVDGLPEEVRLLAARGVEAASVHLVRFAGLAADPKVREPLRFDLRRIARPLAEAWAEADRAGMGLHAIDVPPCVHRRLSSAELRMMKERTNVTEHRFEAAAFAYESGNGHRPVDYDACRGCLLDGACPKAPADYLPRDPAEVLRPITAASAGAMVDEALAALRPDDPGAPARVIDLEAALHLLGAIGGQPEALAGNVARVQGALADLMVLAARRRDASALMTAFCGWLGLRPLTIWSMDAAAWASLALPPARLATRPVTEDEARGRPRAILGDRYVIAVDAPLGDGGEVASTALRPVVSEARTPAEKVGRALFLMAVVGRLRAAARVRITPEGLFTEAGAGWSPAWMPARPGAIRVERA